MIEVLGKYGIHYDLEWHLVKDAEPDRTCDVITVNAFSNGFDTASVLVIDGKCHWNCHGLGGIHLEHEIEKDRYYAWAYLDGEDEKQFIGDIKKLMEGEKNDEV